MLSVAAFYDSKYLKNACMDFIELNAGFIIKSENFLKVTYVHLLEIISHDILAADEIDIFEAMCKWIKENKPEVVI
uniref:BACK domain-containing protein n=1 Tax=Acrobeloides nanus TaxID=290746 RepID=A0A914CID4_9BILA